MQRKKLVIIGLLVLGITSNVWGAQLVDNSGFEQPGYAYPQAAGWTNITDPNPDDSVNYEAPDGVLLASDWNIQANNGDFVAGKAELYGTAGVSGGYYQVVPVLPGATYTIFCFMYTDVQLDTAGTPNQDDIQCRLGYDLTGGKNPESTNIVWTNYQSSAKQWTRIGWGEFSGALGPVVTAASDEITIFLMYKRNQSQYITYAFFDDCYIQGEPAPPPPTYGPTGPNLLCNGNFEDGPRDCDNPGGKVADCWYTWEMNESLGTNWWYGCEWWSQGRAGYYQRMITYEDMDGGCYQRVSGLIPGATPCTVKLSGWVMSTSVDIENDGYELRSTKVGVDPTGKTPNEHMGWAVYVDWMDDIVKKSDNGWWQFVTNEYEITGGSVTVYFRALQAWQIGLFFSDFDDFYLEDVYGNCYGEPPDAVDVDHWSLYE